MIRSVLLTLFAWLMTRSGLIDVHDRSGAATQSKGDTPQPVEFNIPQGPRSLRDMLKPETVPDCACCLAAP